MPLAAIAAMPLRRSTWSACTTTLVGLAAMALLGTPVLAKAADAPIRGADMRTILGEIRRPGAKAVLVNVWATWCDPCRAELPGLLRFFREHRAEGLRLVLVSADDEADRDKAARFLASQGVDFATWIKRGDDMTFINALDSKWSGALPASFLFDGRGRLQHRWYGQVAEHALEDALKAAWDRPLPRRTEGTP